LNIFALGLSLLFGVQVELHALHKLFVMLLFIFDKQIVDESD